MMKRSHWYHLRRLLYTQRACKNVDPTNIMPYTDLISIKIIQHRIISTTFKYRQLTRSFNPILINTKLK